MWVRWRNKGYKDSKVVYKKGISIRYEYGMQVVYRDGSAAKFCNGEEEGIER